MSTLLFFLPRDRSTPVQNGQELIDVGITYVDAFEGVTSNYTISGPGGQGGAIASLHTPAGNSGPAPVYRPDQQHWRKHASGKYWVGYYTDDPPTPETLQRRRTVDGVSVRLIGGGDWIVPVCVPSLIGTGTGATLPRQYGLNDSGEVVSAIRKDFASLADRCFAFFQRYIGNDNSSKSDDEKFAQFKADLSLASDLLAVNYRVSYFEAVGVLELFGSEEYGRVLRAAIEADAIDQAVIDQRKKGQAPDASDTSSGESGSPAAAGASMTIDSATSNSCGS